MNRDRVRFLALVAASQVAWFAVVLSAARGWIWAGPAVAAVVIVAACLNLDRAARGRWLVAVALLGLAGGAADSLLATIGLVKYAAALSPWIAPPWIASLWCLVAVWLPGFSALAGRPWIAALVGAVGGPAAYLSGARLGAASFPVPAWPSLLALAVVWGIALPLLLRTSALARPVEVPA